jgi:hypothetical protein
MRSTLLSTSVPWVRPLSLVVRGLACTAVAPNGEAPRLRIQTSGDCGDRILETVHRHGCTIGWVGRPEAAATEAVMVALECHRPVGRECPRHASSDRPPHQGRGTICPPPTKADLLCSFEFPSTLVPVSWLSAPGELGATMAGAFIGRSAANAIERRAQ